MTHTELVTTMPLSELKHWVAYYKLEDEDYRKRMDMETQKEYTADQEAERMRAMLMGLGK